MPAWYNQNKFLRHDQAHLLLRIKIIEPEFRRTEKKKTKKRHPSFPLHPSILCNVIICTLTCEDTVVNKKIPSRYAPTIWTIIHNKTKTLSTPEKKSEISLNAISRENSSHRGKKWKSVRTKESFFYDAHSCARARIYTSYSVSVAKKGAHCNFQGVAHLRSALSSLSSVYYLLARLRASVYIYRREWCDAPLTGSRNLYEYWNGCMLYTYCASTIYKSKREFA